MNSRDRRSRFEKELEARRQAEFWANPQKWPFDPPEHQFVARVTQTIAEEEDCTMQGARRLVRERCAYGSFKAKVMRWDGRLLPIAEHVWNTDEALQWLATCQAPLTISYEGGRIVEYVAKGWIFIEKSGLKKPSRDVKYIPESRIDEVLAKIYKRIEDGEIDGYPAREKMIDLVQEELPNAGRGAIKERLAPTRPEWWRKR